MFPTGLKIDRDGLRYLDDKTLIKNNLLLDKRGLDLDNKYYTYGYFAIDSSLEYIIKYCYTTLTKGQSEKYKEMLANLVRERRTVRNTDLPIGYFRERNKLAGLIIKYYKDGISFDKLLKEDLSLLSNYYLHDEDIIHNLFLLFLDIVTNIEEMFDNRIYYTDINPGNFILTDNRVKIIDFEPDNVKFDERDKRLRNIIWLLYVFINKTIANYKLESTIRDNNASLGEVKVYIKKLEDNVRLLNGTTRTF